MPFARVGAMPQPVEQKQQRNPNRKDGGNSSSKQKGITMEDLKKQTALRLAQEQQQQQQHHGGQLPDHGRERPFRPLSEHQIQSYGHASYNQADGYVDQFTFPNQGGHHVMPPPTQQMHHQSFHQSFHQLPNTSNPHHSASYENFPIPRAHSLQHLEDKRVNARHSRGQRPQSHQGKNHHSGPRSPSHKYNQDQRSRYHRSGSAPSGLHQPSQQSFGESDASNHAGANPAKQKLPHGLTVHELKEMTKARLQAEAAEKNQDGEGQTQTQREATSFDNSRPSPLDFDPNTEVRERAMSRDSANRNSHLLLHHGSASDTLAPVPSLVQVSQANQSQNQQSAGRQPQVSPLPPGFQTFAAKSPSVVVEQSGGRPGATFDVRQGQPRLEAWETASVASHNSTVLSDNVGSESAVSSGFGSGMLPPPDGDMSAVPFHRSRSYPVQHGSDEIPAPPPGASSPGAANAFFDLAVGGVNRRRAATLSPKPGLIHEDRPHFSGGEDLLIPNFSSSRGHLLAMSRQSYSPVFPSLGLDASFVSPKPGHAAFPDSVNRPRTSSTTSLPPISSTAEEFALDHPVAFQQFSSSNPAIRNAAASDPYGSSFGDNVGGAPLMPNGREGPERAQPGVFRDDRSQRANLTAPPPGFNPGNGARGDVRPSSSFGYYTPAFSRVGSTDSGPEFNQNNLDWGPVGNAPGSSSLLGGGTDASLANDLGSLLKLSGPAIRPDRERSNTYPYSSQPSSNSFISDDFAGGGGGMGSFL